MKKNTAYTIGSLIILLICAFCFVVLPAFTGTGKQKDTLPAFGKYKNREIKYEQGSDFSNFVTQYSKFYSQLGQQLNESDYYYIFYNAFNSTLMEYAYTDAVNKSGYEVPRSAINNKIRPYFSEDGVYSSKLWRQASDETKQELTEGAKKQLTSSRFFDDNFGSEDYYLGSEGLYGMKESDNELSFLQKYDTERRGFNMAMFNLKDYPEEEKVIFAQENKDKFAKYSLSIITFKDSYTINDKEVKVNPARFSKKTLARIEKGELTFEDAINQYSSKSYSDIEGKLTNNFSYQIENMLENPEDFALITDLGKDAISPVIQTKFGYSIFKCTGSKETPDFNSQEVIQTVSNYLSNFENTRMEEYFIAKAKDLTSEAIRTDFESACEEFGIENTAISPFPLNYGNVKLFSTLDTSIKGLSIADTNETFLKTAFSLRYNEISKPFVMGDSIVVLQYTIKDEVNPEEKVFNASEIVKYNQDSAQNAILTNPDVENNFSEVYFGYMMR